MPDNPAALLAEATAAFFPVLIPVQAGLFLLLLLAVSFCDIRSREIPDSLQVAIAASTFLCFSPGNLLGILGALPYLVIALFLAVDTASEAGISSWRRPPALCWDCPPAWPLPCWG